MWANRDSTTWRNPIAGLVSFLAPLRWQIYWLVWAGSSLGAYCDGLIDTGLSRLPAEDDVFSSKPAFHGRVGTHARLLDVGRKVIRKLSQDLRIEKAAAATLGHADLHKRNIFVSNEDPTVITDFIDWQSFSIEPAFEYAYETPDFTTALPNTSPEDQRAWVQADLCKQAFDACLQCLAPKLYTARTLDGDLLRPFRYCHRTWKDGAVAFRHELIEVSRGWKELGLSGSCPYQTPTLAEMRVHQKDYQSFVVAQQLKQRLTVLLDCTGDGWIPASSWEATKKAQKEIFHEIIESIRNTGSTDGESISKEDLRSMWPFDIIWAYEPCLRTAPPKVRCADSLDSQNRPSRNLDCCHRDHLDGWKHACTNRVVNPYIAA